MKSIKLNNDIYIDSTSIVHNRKKLSDILNYKYILATTTTSTSNVSKVVFNSIVQQNGGFLLSNGSIVIPSGITRIRVCASVFIDVSNSSNRYFWGRIKKNSSLMSGNLTPTNGDTYLSCSISPTVIDVEEGDLITLEADNTCSGKNRTGRSNTWILIEDISN